MMKYIFIKRLKYTLIHQIWYADALGARGSLTEIRKWWDKLVEIGPIYGYLPNNSKPIVLERAKICPVLMYCLK